MGLLGLFEVFIEIGEFVFVLLDLVVILGQLDAALLLHHLHLVGQTFDLVVLHGNHYFCLFHIRHLNLGHLI